MVSSLTTTRLNLSGVSDFASLDLWFNRVLFWNVGVSTKIQENIIYGYYSKCLCPARKVTVREIYSHPEVFYRSLLLYRIKFFPVSIVKFA